MTGVDTPFRALLIGSDVNNDSLYKRAWTYTAGHWDLTTMLATVFDDELGQSKKTFRLVTQAVVDRVFDRLMPIPKL